MTEKKRDERVSLEFLSRIEKRLSKIRELRDNGSLNLNVQPYFEPIKKAVASTRQRITNGEPHNAELIEVFRLVEQMHWSCFVQFEPIIIAGSKRWTQLSSFVDKGHQNRNDKLAPKRSHCRNVAKKKWLNLTIENAARQIYRHWKQDCTSGGELKLIETRPSKRSIRRYIEDLYPSRTKVNRNDSEVRTYVFTPHPDWSDVTKLRDAQSIKTIKWGNLARQYIPHRTGHKVDPDSKF